MTPLYKQHGHSHQPRLDKPPTKSQLDTLLGSQGIVILAPHPDDEILGCGALMAKSVAQGIPVWVIYLTDGGASRPDLTPQERTQLVLQRQNEALAGLAALGIPSTNALFVGAPDGQLHISTSHANLAIYKLHELILQGSVSSVFVTAPTDAHIDHQSAYALAVKGLRDYPGIALYTYPVSSRIDDGGGSILHTSFDICIGNGSFEEKKRKALACHASQLQNLPQDRGFSLAPQVVDYMCRGPEYFQAVEMPYGH
jgi:LmbE family N-acetylglucosaminyl deacetylase